MTTNLFPLAYWAPAFQRVPPYLRALGKTYALKERRRGPEPKVQIRSRRRGWTEAVPELGPRIKLGHEKTALALAGRSLAAIDLGLADFAGLDQRVHADLGQIVPVPVHA